MNLRLKLCPIFAAIAFVATTARARFVEPFEIAKEPVVKAAAEKLRTLKDKKDAEPIFKEISVAAATGSGEANFMLAFLYHSGLAPEQGNDKAKAAYEKAAEDGVPGAKNNLGLLRLALGEDAKAAIVLVEESANAGYSPAQVSMGQMFLDGVQPAGIARDLDQARVWFERAADAGDDDASLTLGLMYENGTGVTADQARATSLLQTAADKGNQRAMLRLAAKLVAGQGIKAEPEKGKALYEKAIAANVPGSKTALAAVYETGIGLAKDEKKAFELYAQAEAEGDIDAINKLGYLNENGIGTKKNEVKALEWYKIGTAKEIPVCIHNLGIFHEEGKGGLLKDDKAAFGQFYKAALKAFVPSQIGIALRYREGKGVMQDTQAALAWLERAMQNNDPNASVNYASILESGEAGFVNYEMAVKIYKELGGKGHLPSMVGLGGMLENGRGVPADYRQAYMQYHLASNGGYKPAEERLEKLKKSLNSEQIKIAEAFVASGGKNTSAPSSAPAPAGDPAAKPATVDPAMKADTKANKPETKPATRTRVKPATKAAPTTPALR